MVMSLYSISELIDIKPQNGLYIHSRSLPFDDEQEIDFRKLENWIAHFGLEQLHAHTSRHLHSDQLKEVIDAINPGKVIPVHTLFPEGFKSMCAGLILPQVGKEITV
jgi:ribonuclease J